MLRAYTDFTARSTLVRVLAVKQTCTFSKTKT